MSRPGIAAYILTGWRFEASRYGLRELTWQPIPLEGRQALPQAVRGEVGYSL